MVNASNTPAASLRKSKKDDVEALLSDLDNLDPANDTAPPSHSVTGGSITRADDAQSLLDDLDDLVKRRTPTPKRQDRPSLLSTTSSSVPTRSTNTPLPTEAKATIDGGINTTILASESSAPPLEEASLSSSFTSLNSEVASSSTSTTQPSWGNWWNSATKLADQARAELEKRAAVIQSQVVETTKDMGSNGTGSGVNAAGVPWTIAQNVNSFIKNNRDLNKLKDDFSKVGKKGWNDLLNVVVPPIEKHEILSINLSHNMIGYDGISDVVFTVLQSVMETHASSQSSEHQLVINKAPERKSSDDLAKTSQSEGMNRSLEAVSGFEQGWKIAESKLSQLVESSSLNEAKPATSTNGVSLPITTCPLYIRIQAVLDSIPGLSRLPSQSASQTQQSHLFLQILLQDPTNSLSHRTISQPIPKAFIDLDFEEHSWVEDLLSESIQGSLQNIALEYIQGRNLGTSLRDDSIQTNPIQQESSKEQS